jgi:hypothetical protein
MRERIERIDELNARIEQLRDQNRRLDAENDHLVEMVRLPPGTPSRKHGQQPQRIVNHPKKFTH